ncbi:MAG: DUF2807 domain-containing protein [Spirochaetaceae bacterium]|jgi:predicted small secreted protein|nr:DUF2807 domain-containing protein [Spirochaetaceae bacterium]
MSLNAYSLQAIGLIMKDKYYIKVYRLVTIVLVSLFAFSACNTIHGNGKIVNSNRTVNDFTGIMITGAANVNINFSNSYNVNIRTDSNVQDYLTTSVDSNGALAIGTSGKSLSFVTLEIEITMPKLKNISVNGAAKIKLGSGNGESLHIEVSGTGDIDTTNYQVNNVKCIINGAGTVKVWSMKTLDCTINGLGTLYYKGNPNIQKSINGIGSIRSLI